MVADPALPRRWTVAYDPTGQISFTGFCFDSRGTKIHLDGFTGPDGPTVGFMFVLGDVVFDPDGGTKQIKATTAVGPSTNKIDATMTLEIVKAPKP